MGPTPHVWSCAVGICGRFQRSEPDLLLLPVICRLEVGVDRIQRSSMCRHEAGLRSLAMDLEVHDASAFVQAADLQVGQLGASQRVEQIVCASSGQARRPIR